ncbi:hypothetical protein ACFW16_34195 [Inquilinus sp. NPDC058860]|uniref:hypothetical protein n=1 Tax=Inquilinus sp. NPDC058860 TaxID=3346652 RepID=UPI0036A47F67
MSPNSKKHHAFQGSHGEMGGSPPVIRSIMPASPAVYETCALLFEHGPGATDSGAAGPTVEEARRLLAAFRVAPDGSAEDERTARLFRLAATLGASFAVPAMDYPGLTVLGARLRQDRPAGGGAAIAVDGVIGCDPSPWRAFQKCIGEAAETLALAAPEIGDAARDDAIETIPPRFAGQIEARTGVDSAAALDAAPVALARHGAAIFRVDLTGRAGIPVVKLLSPDLQPSSAAAMTKGLHETASQSGRPLNSLKDRPAIFNSL